MEARHRLVAKRTNLSGSPGNLSSKRMTAEERAIECRPRLLARVIVVRADLFDDNPPLDAHVRCLQEGCEHHRADQPRRVDCGCARRMDPIDRALSVGARIRRRPERLHCMGERR